MIFHERGFPNMKRGICVILSLVLAFSVMSGAFASGYTEGQYTAAAKGNNGDVTVTVEVSGDKILSVTVTEHSETPGVADPALETIPKAIVENQSLAVDAVTGATNTSNAILQAAEAALAQAGADIEALKTPIEKETAAHEDRKTDVLIIGGGLAGLAAAVEARDCGANVILVEKMASTGGTSALSGGGIAAPGSKYQLEAGIDDSVAAYVNQWLLYQRVTDRPDNGSPDKERITWLASQGAETIDWLVGLGYEFGAPTSFGMIEGADRFHYPSNLPSGQPAKMTEVAKERGAEILLNTRATELIVENGRVTGAVVENEGQSYTIQAKAVVLATGGYSYNEELIARLTPENVNTVHVASVGSTGDGLLMAEKIGAALYKNQWLMGMSYSTPADDGNTLGGLGGPWTIAMMVDRNGERFMNENAHPNAYSKMIMRSAAPYYCIYDSSDEAKAAILQANEESKYLIKGETLKELADKAGFEPDTFIGWVQVWNSGIKNGTDAFGARIAYETPITTGPFYAVRMVPTNMDSMGGIVTDTEAKVLRADGSAIEGLYAAGAISNGALYDTAYMSGSAVLNCYVMGRTAGRNAAAEKSASALSFVPGTYSGEGRGVRSAIKVDVTFSEDAITDITVTEHGETRNVADAALEKIPADVLAYQSLDVDTVTSATFTSRGVLNAIEDACVQAGGDLNVLKAKRERPAPKDEEVETDVVVVGMGLAGVTASMSALDQGAKVVAVEKASAAGGSSKYSGGFITAVNSIWQQEAGFTLDVDGYFASYNSQEDMSVKKDETDRQAMKEMIARSASDLEFLDSHGDPITGPDGFGSPFTVWHYPASRTSAFDGEAAGADHIVAGMKWLNEKEGFSVYYDTEATEILTDENGQVAGVVCKRRDGSTLTVHAKSVVLATGGWAASRELMARFCPTFPQDWVLPYTASTMYDTGDGILMAEKLGADVYEDGWWMDLAIGVDAGGHNSYFPDTLNGLINYANYYVVDGEGARVFNTNALYGPRSIAFSDAMARTGKIYSIFTAAGFPAGIQFIEENQRVDGKEIFKADTLEELAELTGMNPETFTAGVERYNGFCQSGVDEDMGQTTLVPIGEGPYYAVSVKTVTMGTIGGLKTDGANCVIQKDGSPIAGLYAAGEIINGKYFNQVYVSGCAQLLCTDSGIIAGVNAAQSALAE